ncbi:MAG: hypothetical protein Q4C72_01960 [Eubacteriales bacterium]|nr:hypothetical protein [Eubacteriales bacterium]
MKKLFSEEEIRMLSCNSYVCSVSPYEIRYTNEFKLLFIEQYLRGKGPMCIFQDAGLPVEVLGYKRIERAAYHWRHAYEEGRLGQVSAHAGSRSPSQTLMAIIREQRTEIRRLRRELHSCRNERKDA